MSGRPSSERVIPGRNAISVGNPCTPLKSGWTWAPLSELAELGTGHTPSRQFPEYWDGDVPWIGLRDANRHHGGVIEDTEQHVTELGLANSAARWLPKDTVCLSRTASVGYVVKMARPMATSQDFVTWSCGDALDPDYLMRALLAEGSDIRRFGNGSTHTTIYFPEVKAFHVALPPLPEQRRIVAKLEALDARAKRARADLDRIPALVARAKQAILAKAFRGDLTADWRNQNPDAGPVSPRRSDQIRKKFGQVSGVFAEPFECPTAWRWHRLPELGDLDRGKSKHRPRNDPRLFGDGYPFIQTGEVRSADRFIFNASSFLSDFGIAQSRLWPKNTVCITIAANIAETALLAIEAAFPDSVVGFLSDPDKAIADYIEFFLRTMRADLELFAPSTAQKNINLDTLASVFVPTPPIAEQQEIVRRIESAFAKIDRIATDATSASKLLTRLDQAILAKAFCGELVPQDPNDEPAEMLLERIRTSRCADTPVPKRRKIMSRASISPS